MKIKIVSDLHLEFSDLNIPNNGCDVLILSGDIMIAEDLRDHPEPADAAEQRAIAQGTGLGRRQQAAQRFRDFLKRCSFQFPHVVYIAGNHEFYNGKLYAGLDYLRAECAKFPNIYFLENETKIIDDVVFIGTTLWTDMNKNDPMTLWAVKNRMNDYRIIRDDRDNYRAFSPEKSVELHYIAKNYITSELAKYQDRRCVVVGHHCPSLHSCHPRYRSDHEVNGAYRSELSDIMLDNPPICLWTHGHTHHTFDYVIGKTRVVCNPRGYQSDGYHEETGFDINHCIEI